MRLLLLALLALSGCGGCASVPEVPTDADLRGLSLRIVMGPMGSQILCGGGPVAADAFVTAAHCIRGTSGTVNGAAVTIVSVAKESADRVRVTLSAPMFAKWAKVGTAKQGDRVRFWGNPRGIEGVYRVGTVVYAQNGLVVTDAMACHGDSGSPMFSDAGEIVAVMSRMSPDVGPCVFSVGEA